MAIDQSDAKQDSVTNVEIPVTVLEEISLDELAAMESADQRAANGSVLADVPAGHDRGVSSGAGKKKSGGRHFAPVVRRRQLSRWRIAVLCGISTAVSVAIAATSVWMYPSADADPKNDSSLPAFDVDAPDSIDDIAAIARTPEVSPSAGTEPPSGQQSPAANNGAQSGSQSGTNPRSAGGNSSGSSSTGSAPAANAGASGAGVPSGVALQPMSGREIREAGAVIENVDVSGMLDVYANDVTIRNCRITSNSWAGINLRETATNLTIQNCEVRGGPHAGILNSGNGWLVARGNDVSTAYVGLMADAGLFENNHVHDPATHGTPTGAGSGGGSTSTELILRGNTIVANYGDATAAIGLSTWGGSLDNVTIENNILSGGSACIDVSYGSNIRVLNNKFSKRAASGCASGSTSDGWSNGNGNSWSGNIWEDSGAAANP